MKQIVWIINFYLYGAISDVKDVKTVKLCAENNN